MAEESTASASSRTGEMSLEEKFAVVRSIGEECIQEEELRNLLAKKPNPICYDGFEPSGRMHIAQAWGVLHCQLSNTVSIFASSAIARPIRRQPLVTCKSRSLV